MLGGKDLINVWEDTYLEYAGDTLDFRVYKDDVPVYSGYAERFPDGTPIRVYINRIARDYLFNGVFDPSVTGLTQDSGACAEFSVVQMNGGVETVFGEIGVVNAFNGAAINGLLNEPINTHADMRQKCFQTYLDYPLPVDPSPSEYLPRGYVKGLMFIYESTDATWDKVNHNLGEFGKKVNGVMEILTGLTEDGRVIYPESRSNIVYSEIRPVGGTGNYNGYVYCVYYFAEPIQYPGRMYFNDLGKLYVYVTFSGYPLFELMAQGYPFPRGISDLNKLYNQV